MRLHWLLLAGLPFLGACAAIDLKEGLSREEVGHLKRVGVVSLLDDSFIGISVGAAVINTHRYTGSVADWNIDGYAEGQAVAILRQNGQFEAAALDHSNLDAEQLRADHSRLVWELAGRQGFDTVVSLWPSLSGNFPLFKPGYGLYDYPSKGPGHRCIYVSYTVEVYDVASRKRIAWEWGGAAPCRMGSEQTLEFKNSFAEYTDAERLLMRKGVEARIAETLAGTLAQLGLVPPAARTP